MTISEFCDKYGACRSGREWALANCGSMADVWDKLRPDWLVWVATRPGVLDDRTLRRFACWCARQVWHLMTDDRSRRAVEVAERYAEGQSTDEELATARAAAGEAAWAAAGEAAWAAAREAARAAAWAAADAAGRADQAAWLRANVRNPFAAEAAGGDS